jgi:hypothetical protein
LPIIVFFNPNVVFSIEDWPFKFNFFSFH